MEVGRTLESTSSALNWSWCGGSLRILPPGDSLADRYLGWIGDPFIAGWPVVAPITLLLLASAVFRWTPADLWISSQFYDAASKSWPCFYSTWCTVFYRGGIYPAFAVGIAGGLLAAWGLLVSRRREWLRAGVFLLTVFALGPGLIINVGFKNHWGRPRPHQLVEFGGCHDFAAIGKPGTLNNHNSSFPSGHAAVAFYLISPAFIARRERPRLAIALLAGGLAFGTCMSATRVMQGGHFASDVMWSAGIVYLTCVVCARVLLSPHPTRSAAAAAGEHDVPQTCARQAA